MRKRKKQGVLKFYTDSWRFHVPFSFSILIIISLSFLKTEAQQALFEKIWGGPSTDIAYVVRQSPDSSLFVFGTSNPGPMGQSDFCLNKLDQFGNLIWTKYYSGAGIDNGIAMTAAGAGWLLVGVTTDSINVSASSDILIIKVDSGGNELWRKVYGGPGNDQCKCVVPAPDGGFILSGFCPDPGGNIDDYILKIDSLGNKVFDTSFGSVRYDLADGVWALPNGNIAVVGCSALNRNDDMEFLMLDSTGAILWDSLSAEPFENGAQGMIINSSNRIIGFGETELFTGSAFDFLVEARDFDGNRIWRTTFGGSGREALFGMTEAPNGDLICVGYSNSSLGATAPENLAIACIDSSGNFKWVHEYGGPQFDFGYSICPALMGGYYATGFYTDTISSQFYLIHVDDQGLLSLPELSPSQNRISVFPNPASGKTFIHSEKTIKNLLIWDMNGRQVANYKGTDEKDRWIDADLLPSGVYGITLVAAGDSASAFKFVVVH